MSDNPPSGIERDDFQQFKELYKNNNKIKTIETYQDFCDTKCEIIGAKYRTTQIRNLFKKKRVSLPTIKGPSSKIFLNQLKFQEEYLH